MIIDTNALSDWADGVEALTGRLPAADSLLLPTIVIGEFKQGILGSTERDALEPWLESIMRAVQVVNLTLFTTDLYAAIQLMTRRKGLPIPTNDAWIAALALEHNLPVLSQDHHFDVIDGLTRASW